MEKKTFNPKSSDRYLMANGFIIEELKLSEDGKFHGTTTAGAECVFEGKKHAGPGVFGSDILHKFKLSIGRIYRTSYYTIEITGKSNDNKWFYGRVLDSGGDHGFPPDFRDPKVWSENGKHLDTMKGALDISFVPSDWKTEKIFLDPNEVKFWDFTKDGIVTKK